jgi:hypothetical protein
MRRHSQAAVLAAAAARAPGYDTPSACTRCARAFGEEVVWRRVYQLAIGLALAALCGSCAEALPPGGAADVEFRDQLEGSALAQALPAGRA